MNRFSAQVKEVVNRNTLVSLALAEGFNAFLPVFDGGIDFILHRESDGLVRKVQLKGRWTIDRKYTGRDLWIAFPIEHEWYLAPHDAMVEMEAASSFIETKSWTAAGLYVVPRPSKALREACEPFRFGAIAQVAAEAESHTDDVGGSPEPSRA